MTPDQMLAAEKEDYGSFDQSREIEWTPHRLSQSIVFGKLGFLGAAEALDILNSIDQAIVKAIKRDRDMCVGSQA